MTIGWLGFFFLSVQFNPIRLFIEPVISLFLDAKRKENQGVILGARSNESKQQKNKKRQTTNQQQVDQREREKINNQRNT